MMRAPMRRWPLIVCSLVALTHVAHADLTSRALSAADEAGGSSAQNSLLTWAGTPKQTSLPDLLQVAVRSSPALQNAKLDIEIAEAQIQQTWARRDWVLRAQASGSWTQSGLVAGVTVGSSKRFAATLDISRMFPTGGTIGLHAGSSYSKTTSTFGPSEYWSDDISLEITQPLLRGRGRSLYDANEARARIARDAAVLSRRLAALETIQTIVSAYWDLVLAQRQIAITESSLALARERLRITEIGANGGKIAPAEIPAVQQIIATREEDVLGGELAVLDRSIALRRSVNMPIDAGDIGLRVATELETQDKGWTLASLLQKAYAASPELATLAKQESGSTIEIEVTENGLLPQLDLALSFGPTGTDEKFGTAAANTFKFSELAASGSLTLTQSLHRDDVRGRVKELRLGREKLRVNALDIRAQIAQTLTRAVAQIELAKRRVVLSQKAIDLANENIRIETDRFNLGKATNFDVLNRQEELRQAELRKAQALIDWHKAETVVMTVTGDLLPAFGITVE
ncbi:MAG TPA: TolC family protein [Kofleriaceae bacterium]|nr:TolC family protein [Kofleriaceae bacterium]